MYLKIQDLLTKRIRRWWRPLVAIAALGTSASLVTVFTATHGSVGRLPLHQKSGTANRVLHFEADHTTYDSGDGLRDDSQLAVTGTVEAATNDPGISPGNDPDGTPIPSIPHTIYQVHVEGSFKGGLGLVGTNILVPITGGHNDQGQLIFDAGPKLEIDHPYLFFLDDGGDGRYYPAAGGSAIASPQPDGSYFLSGEVTGGSAIEMKIDWGTVKITNKVVPSYDPGQFNLVLDGQVLSPNTKDGAATAETIVGLGQHVVSETAGADTILDANHYVVRISCNDGSRTHGTSLVVNVSAGQNLICQITNTRKLHRV